MITISLEQCKRLKDIGFPQNNKGFYYVYFSEINNTNQHWILCQRHLNVWWHVPEYSIMPSMFNDSAAVEIVYAPSDKEMIDWLISKCKYFAFLKFDKSTYVLNIDSNALLTHTYSFYFDNINTPIGQHQDSTECLVSAIENIMKGISI